MALNSNTELALVNTNANTGTINLPSASTSQGRALTFKDSFGRFGTNSLTLQCDGSDRFEDGSSTKVLTENNGIIQIVASGTRWYVLTGTQQNFVNLSTLQAVAISSINISTTNFLVSSLTFTSTNTITLNSTFAIFNSNIFAGTRVYPFTNLNSSSFSPYQVAGLSLWMDASDTSAVRLSGANVVSIADKSGQGYTMTSVGTVPYVTAAQNGLNAVGNLTSANYLRTSTNNFDFNQNDFAVFAAFRTPPTVGGLYPVVSKNMGFGTGTPANNFWYFWLNNTNPPSIVLGITPLGGIAGSAGTNVGSPTTPSNAWVIGSSTIYRFSNNSLTAANGNPGTLGNRQSGPLIPGSLPILIGATLLGTSLLGLTSLVGEVLIYNGTVSTFQRQQMEGYLAWKWGLQANLPASHPFRNAPPT